MILDDIVAAKKRDLVREKYNISIADCTKGRKTINLKKTIKNSRDLFIIAEIKKASPSKGILKEDFDYMEIANDYINSGVGAISILTEKNYFLGSNEILKEVRSICPLPILRKDFIIDPWQIYESRLIGADIILLIAAILDKHQIKEYYDIAKSIGLSVITEVHNHFELYKVLDCGCDIIGINNRNLSTFEENITTTGSLAKLIDKDNIIISESAIRRINDIKYVKEIGVNGVLIGEAFMRAPSIKNEIEKLRKI